MERKQQIIELLRAWIKQRPSSVGMDPRNYDAKGYSAEMRDITKDLRHARELLRAVESRESITADDLAAVFPHAFSGRLTLETRPDGRLRLDYCTGQYTPTEYRKAACAVLAAALWNDQREHRMPAPDSWRVIYTGDDGWQDQCKSKPFDTREAADHYRATVAQSRCPYVQEYHGEQTPGDWLRRSFKREFGASIANRWFN